MGDRDDAAAGPRHVSSGIATVVRLRQGDLLIEAIERVMKENYARNALVQFGIGSLARVEFGVLPTEGPHVRHVLEGPVELVHLGGLVVGEGSQGPYSSHLHVAVATQGGDVKGGHLFSATVGLVVEAGLLPLHDSRLRRVHDPKRAVDLLEI